MLGAIAGDIIGAPYEGRPHKRKDFPLFISASQYTDDTVLTIATADAILNQHNYQEMYQSYGRAYPHAGYGGFFMRWLFSHDPQPYNSWGNGSAMRVSPVGFAFHSLNEVMEQAKQSAEVTHNHPEGIKGAQATAVSVFLARQGSSKEDIRSHIEKQFNYDLNRKLDDIRAIYHFDPSCQGTVPESLIAFLESDSLEDAIRNAISLGGDSDTMACIAGGVAQAFYGDIPGTMREQLYQRLPSPFIQIVEEFESQYMS